MKTIHFKDMSGRYIYFAMDILCVLYKKDSPYEIAIEYRGGDKTSVKSSVNYFYFKSPFRAKWAYRKIARQLHKN